MKNLKILVVDDVYYNIDALKIILGAVGLDVQRQVHIAMNGQQAFEQV
jgi:CheY-like chemotaxis protein